MSYDFKLPPELIAQSPADPRDSSRLFVYDTKADRISLDTFANISKYLPSGSLLILNDTKVVPARLELKKKTGGIVRILFLFNEWDRSTLIKGLPDKGVAIGEELFFVEGADAKPIVKAESHVDEEYSWKLLVDAEEFESLCANAGRTPLPPYINSNLSEEDRRSRYQTTFAVKPASVAAPTASLHFTDRVFESLAAKGIGNTTVTLHVGRGTFSPVTDEMLGEGKLHSEPLIISTGSASAIADAKHGNAYVIAAGTTSLRALESAGSEIMDGRSYSGDTSIFIRPPYKFKIADALITNFHLPGTSLLMLLDAFLQNKEAKRSWRELYDRAIEEKLRFYSFGDSMLII